MPTMHDVARRASVSLSTVSYAISGTRPISKETRLRIFAAMEELGYHPHALARGLASKRSRIVYLREIGFPFSIIGRCIDLTGIAYTDIDFEQTVHDAVMHLIELGHTHIAFLNYAQEVFDAGYGPTVRVGRAFQHLAQEAGFHGISRFCHASARAGYAAFNTLMDEVPQVTAIAAMNERSFPGMLQAIADRGWCVPGDISLISLVSSPHVAEMSMPPLTTLAPPAAELGRLGVELLVQQLDGRPVGTTQTLLPCRLVPGGSTGVRHRAHADAGA
jgi:DNA-binding LacI/PurR family transcriptional regulator